MSERKMIAILTLATAVLVTAGCRSAGSRRASVLDDPAIADLDAGDRAYLGGPADRPVTVVDRHPLLYKPREYWESSGDNRLVKAAAATFIGVPVGLAGEVRQIFTGQPAPLIAPTTEIDSSTPGLRAARIIGTRGAVGAITGRGRP